MRWGVDMGEGGMGSARRFAHHFRSSWVSRGGVLGRKGLLSKMVSIASRLIRYGRPSGKIWAACVSFPCSFCTSWRVCAQRMFHSCMELMYFMRLRSARAMVWFGKFHVKPMKVGLSEKGISLDISHGIPSSWEMRSMSLMS